MQINKSSWHYKFNKWVAHLGGGSMPEKTTLCRYFWRTFLLSPLKTAGISVMASLLVIFIALVGFCVYLAAVVAWLGGFVPRLDEVGGKWFKVFRANFGSGSTLTFKRNDPLFTVHETPIYPWVPLLVSLIIGGEVIYRQWVFNTVGIGWNGIKTLAETIPFHLLLWVAIPAIMTFGALWLFGTKTWKDTKHLVGSYIKANKEKVCPLITFVD